MEEQLAFARATVSGNAFEQAGECRKNKDTQEIASDGKREGGSEKEGKESKESDFSIRCFRNRR